MPDYPDPVQTVTTDIILSAHELGYETTEGLVIRFMIRNGTGSISVAGTSGIIAERVVFRSATGGEGGS